MISRYDSKKGSGSFSHTEGRSYQKKRCRSFRNYWVFHVLLVLCSLSSHAQSKSSATIDSIRTRYEIATKPYLYNGYEYVRYDRHIYDGLNPYYIDRDYAKGDIWYEGRHFHNIPVMYDIVKDLVITPNNFTARSIGEIALNTYQVDSFTLRDHFFVNIVDSSQVRPGFYARLYSGRTTILYGRLRKNLEVGKIMPEGGVWDVITTYNRFYLVTDTTFHLVNTRTELSHFLHQKKSAVKRFMRKEHLDFKHDKETALVETVRHFDPQ